MKKKLVKNDRGQNATFALIILDIITDFEFEDGDALLRATLPTAKRIAKLKARVQRAGGHVIYVNDNFGKWREDFRTMVDNFAAPGAKGRPVVDLLRPAENDYYVLKPHRSAFYSTSLAPLLQNLAVTTLILTGVTTDICILFTANDAYMRGFKMYVPFDCVAAVKPEHSETGLAFLERVLKVRTTRSDKLRLDRL